MFDYEDLDMAEDVKQALAPAVSSSEKSQGMLSLLIFLLRGGDDSTCTGESQANPSCQVSGNSLGFVC